MKIAVALPPPSWIEVQSCLLVKTALQAARYALDVDEDVDEAPVAVAWAKGKGLEAQRLAARLGLPLLGNADAALLLCVTGERLELRESSANAAGPVYADFVAGRVAYRRKHGGGRGQPLARAVGLRGGASPTVVDATAGLGRDAFVLASLGAKVRMLERSVVSAALLEDALQRARNDAEVAPIVARMTLVVADAVSYLESCLGTTDLPEVIYLDPMYPHTNSRALQKKEMRLFRQLVGADDDAPRLLSTARQAAHKRVVVKRPRSAPFLGDAKPDTILESKNTRFDLYFPG